MNKLKADKNDLINFSISKLKDYEGCPDASKLLFKHFGDQVDSLFNHEQYVLKLILEHNKPHWAINFILNLIHEEYRLKFFNLVFKDCLDEIKDKNLLKELKKGLKALKNNEDYELKDMMAKKKFEAETLEQDILLNEEKYNFIMFQIKTIESLMNLLCDKEKRYTRSLTLALSKIADAKSYLDISTANENLNNKQIALKLLDYSGIFK